MGASAGGGGFGGFGGGFGGGGGGGGGVGGGGTGTFGGGRSGMFRATPAMVSPQPSGGPIGNILTSAMGGFRGMQPTSPFVDPYASRVPNFMTSSDTMSPQQYAWTQTPEGRAAGGQEQMNTNIQQNVRNLMGDYGGMINLANQNQTSEADIARALGVSQSNVYTAMNRPGYQQYGPSGQFYQPIYRQQYTNYSRSPTYYQPSYGMSLMSPEAMGYGFGSFNPFSYYAEGGEVAEDEGIAALRNA